MATIRTRWLLSIFLVNLKNCFAPGPPAAPPRPDCYIPYNCVDIHCSWDTRPDPVIPINYSLHWEPAISEEGHAINGTSLSGIIPRKHFSRGELHVWVQAKNQHGHSKSQKAVFHTGDIMKMSPPEVTWSHQDSLEIDWIFTCEELQYCDVRHRNEADQVWIEDEDVLQGSYTLESPKPCTVYEFQVRCSCAKSLRSDWSDIVKKQITEMAPVGELDVWRDCGISQANSGCVLTWKKLPVSQACGLILGYEVRLSYNNGTTALVNVSTSEPAGRVVCTGMQCFFNYSLKHVSSVSVSAYNAHGATVPSHLAIPTPGKEKNEQTIHLKMNEENLTVSWDLHPQLSDNLKEYVVQYKQAGCLPGRGFDWVKVNKSQTTGVFKGRYQKYTPYQVSLFTVSHSSKVHHLSSAIGYSVQGTPSGVPSVEVSSIDSTHVILFWKPVPLSKRKGLVLYYQVIVYNGLKKPNVYNVSAPPQHENTTYTLSHLSPEQDYEVRVRAVTAAGPGANATANFKTSSRGNLAVMIPIIFGILSVVVLCLAVTLCRACNGKNKACPLFFLEKVPDASNSKTLKQFMKNQINEPMAWICIPISEPHPKISLLEVVETHRSALNSSLWKTSNPDGLTRPAAGEGCSQMDCQDDQREDAVTEECQRTDHRYGREEYSKMLDSDEERDREDGWSSTEEEQSTCGYEKHFMPTAFEVQVV